MTKIEELLNRKQGQINQLQPPMDLEVRLMGALQKARSGRKVHRSQQLKIAALLIMVVLGSWQSDTLAYYGKKLIGYETVMDLNLQELNELGKGQSINKSYRFDNDIQITLDGILMDDNQLLTFFTISDPGGDVADIDVGPELVMQGKRGSYNLNYAQGQINDAGTEIKYMASFAPPGFLDNKLKFCFSVLASGGPETAQIPFTLDRDKAMGHTLKRNLDWTIAVDGEKIRVQSITATPTVTVIKGVVQTPLELAWDQVKGERIRPNGVSISLIANGHPLTTQSSGMSTDFRGITFHQEFEPLPAKLESLQLRVESFKADHDVDTTVPISRSDENQRVVIKGQSIMIEEVRQDGQDTFLTLTTEEGVVLTRVHLVADGQRLSLEETTDDKYNKTSHGEVMHTRTLHFLGAGQEMSLDIQRMIYEEKCEETLEIPLDRRVK